MTATKTPSIIIKPQEGQEEFLSTSADICIFGGAAGGGKAQPLSATVMTPFGPKTMGSLKVGSLVSNPDGTVAKVIQVFPQGEQDTYRVTFSDGATTLTTAEHLWLVKFAGKTVKAKRQDSDGETTSYKIADTAYLQKYLEKQKTAKRPYWPLIPLTAPVKFTVGYRQPNPFPVDPYVLGVLLGDGCLRQQEVLVSTSDPEIITELENRTGLTLGKNKGDNYDYRFNNRVVIRQGLEALGVYNLLSHEKFVPPVYKTASIEIRKTLLQGLMDTDGTVDERGHCAFYSTSLQLARDVQWLVRSLGGKATLTDKATFYRNTQGEKVDGKLCYAVYIQTKANSELFRLPRKKQLCNDKFNGGYSELKRRMVSIEYAGREQCQCIKVDHPNSLYITDDFIVTHNTWALLMEPLRHINNPEFNAVIFRESYPQVHNPGGLWDTSMKLYPKAPLYGRGLGKRDWFFPSGMYVAMRYLSNDLDCDDWQGAQVPLFMFDELTHFSEYQFFYMLSRNRTTSGVQPYMRATCNPDPDSWVADFISWWIAEDGYADPEKSGRVRWFVKINDEIHWADNPGALYKKFEYLPKESVMPKSVTFILSTLYNNKILMEKNPGYLANLLAMDTVQRERFLGDKERGGNWKIRLEAGMIFKYAYMQQRYRRDDLPAFLKVVQAIDTAAKTGVYNDYSVIATWATDGRRYYLLDEWRAKKEYTGLKEAVLANYAKWKPDEVLIEDTSAGQSLIQDLKETTALPITPVSPGGIGKIAHAESVSPLFRAGKVLLPDTDYHEEDKEWVGEWIREHVGFPAPKEAKNAHDDRVDTTRIALQALRDSIAGKYRILNLLGDDKEDFEENAEPILGVNETFDNLLKYWNGKIPLKNPLNKTYAVDFLVQTRNPIYLDSVANQYSAVLMTDGEGWYSTGYVEEDGCYILRCFSDPTFVCAMIENQGYGKVKGLRATQPADFDIDQ